MFCSMATDRLMDITDVLAIGGPMGVGTRDEHVTTRLVGKLKDGTFAICLSPQMTAN